MIGNDIVDVKLAAVQSNWQRKGFLTKIFTEDEQTMILNSENPFQLVWLFWSMKESAYKIYVQKYQDRFFAPKKFQCKLISEVQGLVSVNNEEYHTRTKITDDFIFTVALETNNDTVEHNYFKLSTSIAIAQSKSVYHELKKSISKKLNLSMNALYIKKNDAGIPKLYQNNKLVKVSFSMSHHGHYGAYSILNTLK